MKKTILLILWLSLAVAVPFHAFAENAALPSASGEERTVDLDLSVMSGTIVYSQVYNMMYDPDAYLGKIIRVAGYYSFFQDAAHGCVYHACVIPDATACCAQGIEFVWAGDHLWPDDYPEDSTDIIVTGRLETYEEDGSLYLHLVDAQLDWGD